MSDDGPGVPAEDRERIFERFARVDDARSRDNGGTGLGLAIVREVIAAHGGTITVDEPPGATFTVTLPLDGDADTAGDLQDELRRLLHTRLVQVDVRSRHPEAEIVAATVALLLCALALQLVVLLATADTPR